MVETILLEDIFTINDMDPGGKKFDKVSRVVAHSEQLDMDMVLDVNSEVYPVQRGDKFTVVLAPTLSLDGVPDEGIFDQVGGGACGRHLAPGPGRPGGRLGGCLG
eukprot:jgi/Mesen1/10119/ME000075S09629